MEDTEDNEIVASEHDRLISAISKLDKTQHITEPTRNEPTNLQSEFNLSKRSKKLDLTKVVKVLGDTAHHVQIGKKLRKTQDLSKVLPKPLEKPQAERIKRATGYEEAKKKVGRWDPVVTRSRTVDFVSFPIKHVETKLQTTQEFITKLKLKSPLEKELDELEPLKIVIEEEEEPVYPMSYEEMVEHRQNQAKLRAQQSYKAAKAKRQSKIKSKKYHRILKKERLKLQLKEFEELQKANPEEALKKLEALEKARALERHTLRHKNTGKWAKSKLVRAKYNKEVRQELAEQLSVSRGLTQKVQDNDSTDDEPDTSEAVPDITLAQDPMNPWMMTRADKSNVDAEFDFGYKKYIKGRMYKRKDDSDDESNQGDKTGKDNEIDDDNLVILKTSIQKLNKQQDEDIENADYQTREENKSKAKLTTKKESQIKTTKLNEQKVEYGQDDDDKFGILMGSIQNMKKVQDKHIQDKDIVNETDGKIERKRKLKTKEAALKSKKLVSTSDWIVEPLDNASNVNKTKPVGDISSVFESFEDDVAAQVEKKLKQFRKTYENFERSRNLGNKNDKKEANKVVDNLEYLKMRNQKVKPIIDEELIETRSKTVKETQSTTASIAKLLKTAQTATQPETTNSNNIDPSRFIEVKPKYLNTALPRGENDHDQLDDDEQVVPKVNIEEVFEEDDVVASFRQEKEDEINKDKPEDIDLSLPGWGSWGGKGIITSKRKHNRLILKAPPKMPRRDENKGDIIIKEFKEPKLAAHKVTDLPFPFTSVKEYEASVRAPLGNMFIPEKAHKKLIRPAVITKAGAIIEPMDEEELLEKKNRTFENKSMIKFLERK